MADESKGTRSLAESVFQGRGAHRLDEAGLDMRGNGPWAPPQHLSRFVTAGQSRYSKIARPHHRAWQLELHCRSLTTRTDIAYNPARLSELTQLDGSVDAALRGSLP
jgi:hypothetical protein